MIFLVCFIAANFTWEAKLNQLEASSTNLKISLQQLQILSTVSDESSIPVSSILSLAHTIESQVKSIENQINQMSQGN